MIKELICIKCPLGCPLVVEYRDNKIIKVTGNSCLNGISYAEKEMFNPTRILTTSIKINDSYDSVVPVKSNKEIPIDLITKFVKKLKSTEVNAPIKIGEVVLNDYLGLNIDIVTTKEMSKIEKKK